MIYKDNAVKDLRIAYIGGGSRGWAWTFMRDLALEPALGGTIVLYDINKEAAKANEVIGNGITKRPEAVGKWKYVVADTLAEALTGSDFVVISILPGTFDEMESDVHEPEKYGIYQSAVLRLRQRSVPLWDRKPEHRSAEKQWYGAPVRVTWQRTSMNTRVQGTAPTPVLYRAAVRRAAETDVLVLETA